MAEPEEYIKASAKLFKKRKKPEKPKEEGMKGD